MTGLLVLYQSFFIFEFFYNVFSPTIPPSLSCSFPPSLLPSLSSLFLSLSLTSILSLCACQTHVADTEQIQDNLQEPISHFSCSGSWILGPGYLTLVVLIGDKCLYAVSRYVDPIFSF